MLPIIVALAVSATFFWRSFVAVLVLAAFGIVVSVPVNPLQRGLDVVVRHDLVAAIARIDKGSGAAEGWITTSFGPGPLLTASGVDHVGAVNLYPDDSEWKLLGPDGSDATIWNRYAHTTWTFGPPGESARLSLAQADVVAVQVDPCGRELDELGVGHVVTAEPTDSPCLELVDPSGDEAAPVVRLRAYGRVRRRPCTER